MDVLDVDGGFDVHEYRASLKLHRQDADATTLSNRGDLGCPACSRRFDRLFVTGDDEVTFGSAPSGPICLVQTDEQLLVLVH